MAAAIDGGEDYFCIDSKPIEICRPACAKRCSMGKNEIEKAPSFGYCASQGVYYYGSLVSRGIFFVDQVPCKLLADVAKFCEYCI